METIIIFKNFLNKCGILGYNIQEQNTQINQDFRNFYLPILSKIEKDIDLIIIFGTNPRLEATLVNIELRRAAIHSTKIIFFGALINLTYKKNHFGISEKSLIKMTLGKSTISKNIIYAKYPMVLFGFETLKREAGVSNIVL